MLRTCRYCLQIHDSKCVCKAKQEHDKRVQEKENERVKQYFQKHGYNKRGTSQSDKFRSTKTWQSVRKAVVLRDINMCRVCWDIDNTSTCYGLSVHHIDSLQSDYSKRADTSNLITLCNKHHEEAERGVLDKEYLRSLASEIPKGFDL